MEPPEFTSKALNVMAAAALIAMACVFWLTTMPAPEETDVSPLQVSPDLPTFKLMRERAPGYDEPLRKN